MTALGLRTLLSAMTSQKCHRMCSLMNHPYKAQDQIHYTAPRRTALDTDLQHQAYMCNRQALAFSLEQGLRCPPRSDSISWEGSAWEEEAHVPFCCKREANERQVQSREARVRARR